MEIPFNIQYMRGGKARLDKLASGAFNFAICSKRTAILAQQDYPNLEILIEFDAHSYIDEPAVVFAHEEDTEICDGMKIGIDEYSYDHVYLNERVCRGKEVTFVPLKYSELAEKLNKGEIDASLWNLDELKEKFILKNVHKLDESIIKEMEDACTSVLVVRNDDRKLQLLMTDILDIDEIHRIQNDVLDKNILPAY